MSGPVRVVLAEDNPFLREGLSRLLSASARVEVVASCGALDELLAAVDAEQPDVVLTDIRMPPTHTDEGIQAATRLRRTNPGVGVLVLSQYLEPGLALSLLNEGSSRRGYVLKERADDVDYLVGAIRTIAAGGSCRSATRWWTRSWRASCGRSPRRCRHCRRASARFSTRWPPGRITPLWHRRCPDQRARRAEAHQLDLLQARVGGRRRDTPTCAGGAPVLVDVEPGGGWRLVEMGLDRRLAWLLGVDIATTARGRRRAARRPCLPRRIRVHAVARSHGGGGWADHGDRLRAAATRPGRPCRCGACPRQLPHRAGGDGDRAVRDADPAPCDDAPGGPRRALRLATSALRVHRRVRS